MTSAPVSIDSPSSNVDLWSDAVLADPYPVYARLRDLGAVVRLERHGLYALTRFDAVQSALTDWTVFSSAAGTCVDPSANEQHAGASILSTDPPAHTEHRRPMASQLSVRSLAADAARVEQTARTLIAGVVERGTFDVVADLARPYALSVLGGVLGLPDDRRETLPEQSERAFNIFGPAGERFVDGLSAMQELVTHAVATTESGGACPGSRAELVGPGQANGILDYTWPGLATTVDAVSSAVYLFARHPEQWDLVRSDSSLIPGAFREVLRLHSPLHYFTRKTTAPARVDGVEVPGGSRVLMMYGSANRDERHYPRPDDFDVRRDPTDHLAFGRGVHRCVGMNLATLEAHTLLGALAEWVERFTLVGEPEWTRNNTLHGLRSATVSVSLPA